MQYKTFDDSPMTAEEARKQLSVTITTRFDRNTASLLREVARAKGIGVTTLIRMWTLDRLRRVGPRSPGGRPQTLQGDGQRW